MAGQITDDELNDRLIKPLMPGEALLSSEVACSYKCCTKLEWYMLLVKEGPPPDGNDGCLMRHCSCYLLNHCLHGTWHKGTLLFQMPFHSMMSDPYL